MLEILVIALLDGLGGVDAAFFDRFEFERVVNRLQFCVADVLFKLHLMFQIGRLLLLHLELVGHSI